MKKTLYILVVSFLFSSVVMAAEVYKTVNPDGSVTYSDKPTGVSSSPVRVTPGAEAAAKADKSTKSNTKTTQQPIVDSVTGAPAKVDANADMSPSSPSKAKTAPVTSKSNSSTSGSGGAGGGGQKSGSATSTGGKAVASPQAASANKTTTGKPATTAPATTTPATTTPATTTPATTTPIPAQQDKDNGLPPKWPWRGVAMDVFGDRTDPITAVVSLKAKGVNSIELVLSVRNVAEYQNKSTAQAWKEALAWADKVLDACKIYGMVGIVTFVQAPEDPALKIKQYSAEFWETPKHIDSALVSIELLVQHFKNRGSELAAYEFFNEPLLQRPTKNENPENWLEVQNRILKVVRRVDPQRFVVVNPGMGGETLWYRNFVPLDDKRVVYGAHFYNPHEYTHQGVAGWPLGIGWPAKVAGVTWNKERLRSQMMPLVLFQKKYNVPVWIGEFSAVRWAPQSEQWLCDAVSLFNEYGFGWMYFAYNGYHGWNPHFDSVYTSDKKEDWSPHDVGETSARWKVVKKLLANGCN